MSLIIFGVVYVFLILYTHHRHWIGLGGVAALILTGTITPYLAIEMVHWNVIALFFGILLLAELFMVSAVPETIVEWLVDRTKTGTGAILSLCILSSFLSMILENVAVVLLLVPIAFKLCQRLEMRPVYPIIFVAIFSNIQGTSTLIGDPPSMILASYLKMNFLDFFFYEGRPSIFFYVQIGAFAALGAAYLLIGRFEHRFSPLPIAKPKSLIPSWLLALTVVLLSFGTIIDPEFHWYAGSVALVMATIGFLWHPKWISWKHLDWETTGFLIAMFVLIGALQHENWITTASTFLSEHLPHSLLGTYCLIIFIAVFVSAFVDNVPFLLAAIPVVQDIADKQGAPLTLLMFGLLIGSCLGGNITPVGASANIVAMGMLKKKKYHVTFGEYVKVGLTLTVATVTASAAALYLTSS